jgi:hypothetical protein
MSDSQVIDFLREQFARVNAGIMETKIELREQRGRLAAIERTLVGIQRGVGHIETELAEQQAEIGGRFDRVNDRLDRIEGRLDLRDA